MARVLVSYRIADSAGHAGRLADALKSIFGREFVFLSADDIAGGTLWRQTLKDQLRLSRVVLAVIGPTWATVVGQDGKPRLMADDDVVRFEIREALGSQLAVVPVLVGSATVPPLSSLPEDIHPMLARNVVTVRDDHWQSDIHMLAHVWRRSIRHCECSS